jgi:hypothetical protein
VTNDKSIGSMLFRPDSKPYGLTYAEWVVKWWRWLLSISKEKNPALDMSGMRVPEKQEDPNVWFLAGTFGGSIARKCKIPSGKAILLPIINYECSFADEPSITTEIELETKCKREIDDIKNLSFAIDQLSLTDLSPYRIRSPLFDVDLAENNILEINQINTKMISDGFWIFVKPLTIGRHQLISSGSCQSGKIMIGVTYDLFIE